jgi:hypothetical protein
MKTLGKREGKALTPRQRVAAAQRWNSLADIGEGELDRLHDLSARTDRTGEIAASRYATLNYDMQDLGLKNTISDNRADNPFLSDNIDKYAEQSEFLDWCRHNRVEPNGQALKQFRWERYKGMSVPQRERIYDNYDPYFLPEERMWYEKNDMPDYLPVGWDNSSNWRY